MRRKAGEDAEIKAPSYTAGETVNQHSGGIDRRAPGQTGIHSDSNLKEVEIRNNITH